MVNIHHYTRTWMTSLLLTGMLLLAACRSERQPLPNLIVILVDDWGWTDAGCYGSPYYQTPNIDRMAVEGIRFTNAYSACTVCSPTRAAMMTGKYPARLNLTDWISGTRFPWAEYLPPQWNMKLDTSEVTLAELLKRKGYATAHVGKWHLGKDSIYWPEYQGFDVNIGGHARGAPTLRKAQGYHGYFSPYGNPRLEDGPPGEYLTDRLTDEALAFMDAHQTKPFFIYLAHYAVHTPLQAKEELIEVYRERRDSTLAHDHPVYAAMIASLDEGIGRVLDYLQEKGLAENTTVILTSDNGGLELWNITDNAPLRAGKGSAYEGGVRVPLIVWGKHVLAPGTLCDEPVITMDYFPTLAEWAGIHDLPEPVDGLSIAPLVADPGSSLGREALYWHYPHYHRGGARPYTAIRRGNLRMVEFYPGSAVELYDLSQDIGESMNLAEMRSGSAAELRAALHRWKAAVKAQDPRPNPDHDPAKADQNQGSWGSN